MNETVHFARSVASPVLGRLPDGQLSLLESAHMRGRGGGGGVMALFWGVGLQSLRQLSPPLGIMGEGGAS